MTVDELLPEQFDAGELSLTEAGSKRRASIHVVAGGADLVAGMRDRLAGLPDHFFVGNVPIVGLHGRAVFRAIA